MHDIRLIRENPAAFDAGLARRGVAPVADAILALDEQRRAVATRMQEGQNRRNEASKAIGKAMGQGDKDTAEALKAEVAQLKETLPALEAEEKELSARLQDELARLPNIPVDEVPDGEDETQNLEVSKWGTPGTFAFTPKEHADLGPALGLDFETGALLSGARFTFLKGQMARLHRALAQFMLDTQTATNGYMECIVPLLVKDDAVFGTGQLPKFAEDLFQTTDGRWLIPTAEVSLTNAVREQILEPSALPLRMTALTPCFRSEAGAAGRDTRGFIRQHQFEKVELVTVCKPKESEAEHERMVAAAESILQALELPYRKVLLCAGDMGATARKTFDLEVWLPGQGAYREISSISNCGDYQGRRMDARFKPEGSKKTEFVHTLNGSGLAVGRTLVAVLENYQQEDGSVLVPEALKPWMGGIEKLEPLR
ncbi:serine--tRNA ligase [Novosphingobium album (ex Hu et al. 2023)]|uniref:Serine--tRNA ligase n=1 Tax=Novosphingobium album (ex Hu et al. 2023) TaxID=2930093 RepID=A0ABT0B1V6_9SPHN|nr:serine--tRNA ligase [Novosphingobium album (ex Hu et al. 2023)]MCJ2178784.1 serine--tRNA ligase [Novosphingobium album (ex Hu et al. 2023)]